MSPTDLPPPKATEATEANGGGEYTLYTSRLTDTRHVEARLRAAGRSYRIETMPMGDAQMRARFHALCEQAGREQLPLVRQGERWVGGEYELLAELDAAADTASASAPGGARPFPAAGLAIGYAGLLPFVAGALTPLWAGAPAWATAAWLAYGLIILAFMAGSQWGAALGWPSAPGSWWARSVAAPLVAWPLAFAQPVFQAYGLALLFGELTMLDRELAAAGRYPPGYLRLRWQLSSVVIVALILGALLRG